MFNIKQITGQAFLILTLGMSAHGAYFDADAPYGSDDRAVGFPAASEFMMARQEGFEVVDWGRVPVAAEESVANSQLLSVLDGAPDFAMDYQNPFLSTRNLPTLNEGDVEPILEGSGESFLPRETPQVLDMHSFNRAMDGLYAKMGMARPANEDELLAREIRLPLAEQMRLFEEKMKDLEKAFEERKSPPQHIPAAASIPQAAAAVATPESQAETSRRARVSEEERRLNAARRARNHRTNIKAARAWIKQAAVHNVELREAYERILREGEEKADKIKAEVVRRRQKRTADEAAGIPVEDKEKFAAALKSLYECGRRMQKQDRQVRKLYVKFNGKKPTHY